MWIRCSAWPALQAATAPLVVVLLLGSVFLGPQGMEVSDLGQLAESHSIFPAILLLFWALAMAPAGKAGLTAKGLHYLRWLPTPRWLIVGLLALLLLALHAPLFLLFFVAGKPATGIALLAGGLGLSSCLLLPNFHLRHSILNLGLGAGIVLLLAGQQPWPAAAVGVLTCLWLLPRQYQSAAQPSRRHVRRSLFGGPRLVLLVWQTLRLRRCESATLMRSLLVALAGAGLVFLIHHGNPDQDYAGVVLTTLVASTPCLAAVTMILALALRRGQEELHWLRPSLGISTSRLRLSSLLLLSAIGVVLAFLLTLLVMLKTSTDWQGGVSLFALLAVHAFLWCTLASALAYRVQGAGRDQSPAMFALCVALLDMVLVGSAGSWSIALELVLALLLASRLLGYSGNNELRHA